MKHLRIYPSRPSVNPYSATSIPLELRTSVKKKRYTKGPKFRRELRYNLLKAPKCTSKRSRGRGPCRGVAIKGTGLCRFHNGGRVRLAIIKREALAMEQESARSSNRMVKDIFSSIANDPADTDGKEITKTTNPQYILKDKGVEKEIKDKQTHPSLLDLREELAILKAKLQEVLNKGKKDKDFYLGLRIINEIKNIVRDIHDMEEGRKILITRENMQITLVKMVAVIRKYVPDIEMQKRMAAEIGEVTGNNGKKETTTN